MKKTSRNNSKKFYTCKYDRVFKSVVIDSDDLKVLKSILSVSIDENIENIEIKNCELPVNHQGERTKTVDLLVELDNRKYVHIELNLKGDDYTRFRNYCFFSHTISNKTKRGQDYDLNDKYIHIDFTYGIKTGKISRKYYVQTNDKEKYVKNVEIIEYDMDYVKENWYNEPRYKYLAMLDMNSEELSKIEKDDEVVMDYKKKIEELNEDTEFQAYMTAEQDAEMRRNTDLLCARREERNEIIISLFKKNVPIEIIAECVKLTIEEVKNIIEESSTIN